jgi:nucleoid DNA-binding protein
MSGFNKREFSQWVSRRLNVPKEEGALLFDAIGRRIEESMRAGETVFLFGQGTLKLVKSRGTSAQNRVRYRTSMREGDGAATVTLDGLSGIASGTLTEVVVVKSVSAGDRAIQVGRPFMASGPAGQITLYADDSGMLRCVVKRSHAAIEESIFDTKKAARDWLKSTFLLIQQPHHTT